MRRLNLKLLMVFVAVVFLIGMQKTAQASEAGYRWLIEPKYDDARHFSEDLWAVKKGELWGYVDSADNVVLDFQYIIADPFRNGVATVVISHDEGKVGTFIDQKGQYLVPPHFGKGLTRYIYDDKNMLLSFRSPEGKYGFLDISGNVKIPAVYDLIHPIHPYTETDKIVVKSGDLYGIIDVEGNWVLPLQKNDMIDFMFTQFWNGYIPFKSEEGLRGLLNTKGEVVLEAKYSLITVSPDGSGPLAVELGKGENAKVGYLDETLTFIISPDRYQPFPRRSATAMYSGGIAFVYEAGIIKALDVNGEIAFEFPAFLAEPMSERVDGYYVMLQVRPGIGRFLVNKSGEIVLPLGFDMIYPTKEGIIAVTRNLRGGKWGLLMIEQ